MMSILICRHCGEPIHESAEVCPHCGGERPEAPPGPPPEPNLELVPIFRTGDAGVTALAKSLLEGEGIEYLTRGDGLQNLYVVGPVEFVVRKDDAPRARTLLRDLANVDEAASPEDA